MGSSRTVGEELTTRISELLARGNEAKVTSEQVKERFDQEDASAYGSQMPEWFPDYDYVHRLLCDILKPYLSGEALVLDLGGGTGRIARLILDTFPSCRIVIQDLSANMLSEVPNKLELFSGRFECVEGDFFAETCDFEPGSFDCVVSVHAIHHGRHQEVYRNLYRRIHTWLKPMGCFVCLDNVAGDAPELAVLNYASWAELLRSQYGAEDTRRIIERTILEDSPLSLREHLSILGECGFAHADVVWKKHIFGLYVGVKDPQQEISLDRQ